MVNPAFNETVVINEGDEGYPSLRSIVLAATSIGLGIAVSVNREGDPVSVRIPHPGVIVTMLMRLATTWDEATAKLAAIRAGDESHQDTKPSTQLAVYSERGKVWIRFEEPIDGIGLDPEEAERIGAYLIESAALVRAEGAADGEERGGPVEA